jgi:hypothetical protein
MTISSIDCLCLVQIFVIAILLLDRRRFHTQVFYYNSRHLTRMMNSVSEKIKAVENSIARQKSLARGLVDKAHLKSKVAESLAERAFGMASSSQVALLHLQKTLVTRPVYATKRQQLINEVAQGNVQEELAGTVNEDFYDYLRPTMTDDEIEALDKALEDAAKSQTSTKSN